MRAMTDASRKIEQPRPRAPKLSIAAYERLTARARAHYDWAVEEDARARQTWAEEQRRAQKAKQS